MASAAPSEWDLTEDELKLIKKRAILRQQTKEEFLKKSRNPFNPALPGHLVDPANTRLYAYQQNVYRYMQTTPRRFLGPGIFVACCFFLHVYNQRHRKRFHQRCCNGEVKWRDRPDFWWNSSSI